MDSTLQAEPTAEPTGEGESVVTIEADGVDEHDVEAGSGVEVDELGGPVFRDAQGARLESWQVPLDQYLAGWVEAWPGDSRIARAGAHRFAIARALLHCIVVPGYVLASHDAALLDDAINRERRIHGVYSVRYCPLCRAGHPFEAMPQ